MSDHVLATDPGAAAALAGELEAAARRIGDGPADGPGADAVFGAAGASLAALPATAARWRGAAAETLAALSAGTTIAATETRAADRW